MGRVLVNMLEKKDKTFGRISGAVPAEIKSYVLIMFDISNTKKYSILTKILKKYAYRIQKSVYEAYIRPADYKILVSKIEKLMDSPQYYDLVDRIRVYRMTGTCNALIYGPCFDECDLLEENVFL